MKKYKERMTAVMMAVTMVIIGLFCPMEVQAAPNLIQSAAIGIDVSRYQGQIDWAQVASSGVQYAIIRVGYRTQTTGILNEDPYAKYNLQEATKYGIKTGAYFFSTAVTAQEAVEEAVFTANIIDKYAITFPVVYNCEGFTQKSSRQYGLGKAERTALAVAFLDTIAQRGYQPMFYASKNEMENSRQWDMDTLASKYKVWVSWYPQDPFPMTPACTYTGVYQMWQYTQNGSIPGISGAVDMNVSYFDYDGVAAPIDATGTAQITTDAAGMEQYTPVYEVVTPSSRVNVRTVPSTADSTTIVATLNSGDMVFRTGVGNNGWSKILLGDQTYFAYTQYLRKVQ